MSQGFRILISCNYVNRNIPEQFIASEKERAEESTHQFIDAFLSFYFPSQMFDLKESDGTG